MNNSMYQEVYSFYKKRYTDGVVLFHIGTEMKAYFKDAKKVSEILSWNHRYPGDLLSVSFQYSQLKPLLDRLIHTGMTVHIVEYRNNNGDFVLPEVKQILRDIEDDY